MHYSNFPSRISVEKTSEQCFQPLLSTENQKSCWEDRDLSAGLYDKQVDGGNEWRGLYNGRKPPQVGDRKILRRQTEQDLL